MEDLNNTELQIGCGVGNTIFPLIKTNPDVFMYACDYSECAIEIIRKNPMFDPNKLQIFVCDLVNESLIQHIKPSSVDITLLIFCLSANRQELVFTLHLPPYYSHDLRIFINLLRFLQ